MEGVDPLLIYVYAVVVEFFCVADPSGAAVPNGLAMEEEVAVGVLGNACPDWLDGLAVE